MTITNIDHIVLTVTNIDETIQFYESVLGMVAETFGEGGVALKFGDQKINLHKQGQEFEPKAGRPVPGSADLCFITETELETAMKHVKSKGVSILEGPIARTGAVGAIVSFYFRDPDGNLIEVANRVTRTNP
ncbi:MAG: VOC family protein [Deltaproteobacteria bacterium]|nr:VOC family protein [Deltaproteobacteria bacterium]